jgi:hypothetical protein
MIGSPLAPMLSLLQRSVEGFLLNDPDVRATLVVVQCIIQDIPGDRTIRVQRAAKSFTLGSQ